MKGGSLAARSLLLAALAVGFWGLGAGLSLGLVGLGVGILRYAPEHAFGGIFALGLALALGFGFVPSFARRATDETPALPDGAEPRLRKFVRDTALDAGARLPAHVFVSHDANAFAGARRVGGVGKAEPTVGIGLGFLGVLTESELSAVLAHEMGHHVAGDVRLGPWVHRTRAAIGRAASRLEGSSFWLHLPFVAYADFFMRTSLRISRAQELAADALAAKVAGAPATAAALRKTEVLGIAWNAYFELEVLPLVGNGRRPALLEGFERYWRAAQTPGTPAFRMLESALKKAGKSREDDSHPTLAERLAALGDPEPWSDVAKTALGLVDEPSRLEEFVLRSLLKDPSVPLAPLGWDEVAAEIWLPMWRGAVTEHAGALAHVTPRTLPNALAGWERIAEATRRGPAIYSSEAERRRVARLLGAWFVVALADRGFVVDASPGVEVCATRDGARIEPFEVVGELAKDPRAGAAAWASVCDAHGLG